MTQKKIFLTKAQRAEFTLSNELKAILIGLLLGDLYMRKQKSGVNPYLVFIQGLIHKEYISHLYSLFESYCRMVPTISNPSPDKRTGKVYRFCWKSQGVKNMQKIICNYILFFTNLGPLNSL
jgi:hypothetical protein